jgi:hypothetical protein
MPVRRPPKLTGKTGKPATIVMNDFKGGTMTLPDESRLPANAVSLSTNMILDEDGVWRPRPGTQKYGQNVPGTGTLDGLATATTYISSVQTNHLFTMRGTSSTSTLYRSTDGGAWTAIAGGNWAASDPTKWRITDMKQLRNRLYIANSVDHLSFVDLLTMNPTFYTQLTAPAAPTITRTTLTSGSYNGYYQVSAISTVGETIASVETLITTNKPRTSWSTTANESLSLSWAAITGAVRYNIYWSDQSGEEVFLDSVTGVSYVDNGQTTPNNYVQAPAFDGTAGPRLGKLCISGNRLWGTLDADNIQRVWWTAAGSNVGSFDPYSGGGYIDLNLGSEERPVDVQHFRDGKGNQQVIVITSSPRGGGQIWFITLSASDIGTVNVIVPTAFSQGSIGSSSPFGSVQAQNNVFYPSIKGFQSVGSSQAIFNVIVTTEVSANIRKNVQAIPATSAPYINGVYSSGKILWAVPYGSQWNNQVWLLDLERQCWNIAWNIGIKQFMEYTDSAGNTHLLGIPLAGSSGTLSENNLIEFSSNFSGDSGKAFPTELQTGLIHFDKDHFTFGWVRRVYFEIGRPKGAITLSISGTKPNKGLLPLKSLTVGDTSMSVSSSGIGSDLIGSIEVGDSSVAPTVLGQSSIKKVIQVNTTLNNIRININTNGLAIDFKLLEMAIDATLLPSADPSSWRK